MRSVALGLILGLAAACAPQPETAASDPVELSELKSAYAFLTRDTQRLQDDPFENPGYLWVDRGEALFQASASGSPSCASCHEAGLKGVANKYPAINAETDKLINLEGRINQCVETHQIKAPLAYESDELLALTTYVANQSRGLTYGRDITAELEPYYKQGEAYFQTRRGLMNLSCQQCHTQSWGKQLRGDTISQGHGNGFPAYRFEWQSLGSLHRRFRDCDIGVRAEPLPYGDDTYVALELYLAARGNGLENEVPGVRR